MVSFNCINIVYDFILLLPYDCDHNFVTVTAVLYVRFMFFFVKYLLLCSLTVRIVYSLISVVYANLL